jgi:hypothetical protein
MSILQNKLRIGSFTSSEIFKLTKLDRSGKKFGVPAIRYIMETNDERLFNRSIEREITAHALSWGKLNEPLIHELLDMDYVFQSDITVQHPEIKFWAGSTDGFHEVEERSVVQYKSPITKSSFAQLVRPLYHGLQGLEAMYAIRDGYNHEGFEFPEHKDGEKFYWQIISDACVNKCDYGELIIFMPYDSQLLELKKMAGDDPELRWLDYVNPEEYAIEDGGFFRNINIIRFEVEQADKDFLTSQVLKAGKFLVDRPALTIK